MKLYIVNIYINYCVSIDLFISMLDNEKYLQIHIYPDKLQIYFDRYKKARDFKERYSEINWFGLTMGELYLAVV